MELRSYMSNNEDTNKAGRASQYSGQTRYKEEKGLLPALQKFIKQQL